MSLSMYPILYQWVDGKNCLEKGAIGMPEGPFCGVTQSGHGSENGIEGIDACLVTKFTNYA